MKWSVYSPILTHNKHTNTDEFIRFVRDCGISAVEIMSVELEERSLTAFKEYYNSYGLEVTGFILFTDFVNLRESAYAAEMNRIRALLQEASDNGIRHVMVVPNIKGVKCPEDKLAARDRMVAGMKEIVQYADEIDITITMENYSQHTHPYSTIDEMLYLMEHIPGLKYTLDAGNFYCVKEDVLKAYDVLKKYLVHAHVKDWTADPFGYIIRPEIPAIKGCEPGLGLIPLKELLARMKQDGYRGDLLAEIDVVEDVRDLTQKDIEVFVNFLKKYSC